MATSGVVYKITCSATGKSYVGQARDTKTKQGVPYRYGAKGRWNDHVSSSAVSTTPLALDIQKFGPEKFTVEELAKADLDSLDAIEADWISKCNTVVPNGYNVMRHSQNKHRSKSNIVSHFQNQTVCAKLRKIRRDGEYKLVYCYLELEDGSSRRIVFGQHKDKTFTDAWNDALVFVEALDVPFMEDTTNSDDPLLRYASKVDEFAKKDIRKIRITKANSLVAVYITTSDATSWKDQTRICFGGKTIRFEEAYATAWMFIDCLPKSETTEIIDTFETCQSPQQVAASMGETSP